MNMRINPHMLGLSDKVGAPSLEALSYALRHPETWPAGFTWDFTDCDKCAMGLANALWPAPEDYDDACAVDLAANKLNMPFEDAESLFYCAEWLQPIPKKFWGIKYGETEVEFRDVTPTMVADAIDNYVKENP